MSRIAEYYRPHTLEEALALLARSGLTTALIGGGSELIAEQRRDVDAVVDLRDLGLSTIGRDGDTLRIGATTTLQALIDTPESSQAWSGLLAQAAQLTATRNLREQGTVAGTLVSAQSNNPLAVTLLALNASVMLMPDGRSIALDEFFPNRPALLAGRLITEVTLPLPRPGEVAVFERVSRTPADLPIVCAAVRARIENGDTRDARIALGGVAGAPVLIRDIERDLARLEPPSDFLGSAEYRREMAAVLVRRALDRL